MTAGTLTVYPTVDGEVARITTGSFSGVRNGVGTHGGTSGSVAQALVGSISAGNFASIQRAMFSFNITGVDSTIPSNAIIQSAVLRVFVFQKLSALGTPGINIVKTTPASNTNISASDYNQFIFTSLGSQVYPNITSGAYNDIPLNSAGIAALSRSGYTELGLVTEWDFNNSFGGVYANSSDSGYRISTQETVNTPMLIITYTVPDVYEVSDDFNGNSIDANKWFQPYGLPINSSVSVSGSKLVNVIGTTSGDSMYLRSSNQYYTTDTKPLMVRFGTVDIKSGVGFIIYEVNVQGTFVVYIYLVQSGGLKINIGSALAGDALPVNYDPTTSPYVRVRISGVTAYLDISADAVTWTNISSISVSGADVPLSVDIYGFNVSGSSGTSTIEICGINSRPGRNFPFFF